jgi:hypothetical protein
MSTMFLSLCASDSHKIGVVSLDHLLSVCLSHSYYHPHMALILLFLRDSRFIRWLGPI